MILNRSYGKPNKQTGEPDTTLAYLDTRELRALERGVAAAGLQDSELADKVGAATQDPYPKGSFNGPAGVRERVFPITYDLAPDTLRAIGSIASLRFGEPQAIVTRVSGQRRTAKRVTKFLEIALDSPSED